MHTNLPRQFLAHLQSQCDHEWRKWKQWLQRKHSRCELDVPDVYRLDPDEILLRASVVVDHDVGADDAIYDYFGYHLSLFLVALGVLILLEIIVNHLPSFLLYFFLFVLGYYFYPFLILYQNNHLDRTEYGQNDSNGNMTQV